MAMSPTWQECPGSPDSQGDQWDVFLPFFPSFLYKLGNEWQSWSKSMYFSTWRANNKAVTYCHCPEGTTSPGCPWPAPQGFPTSQSTMAAPLRATSPCPSNAGLQLPPALAWPPPCPITMSSPDDLDFWVSLATICGPNCLLAQYLVTIVQRAHCPILTWREQEISLTVKGTNNV